MSNPHLNTILKWSIENSEASQGTNGPRTQLTGEAVRAVFDAMGQTESIPGVMANCKTVLDNKKALFDDQFAQLTGLKTLIENLDNANLMKSIGLWTPLVKQLEHKKAKIRELAASCCGDAVQNNIRTQEELLEVGAIPTLVRVATTDPEWKVRKAAITALSSAVRNFQPGLDEALLHMPTQFQPQQKIDAADMDSVNTLITKMRDILLQEEFEAGDTNSVDISTNKLGDSLSQEKLNTSNTDSIDVSTNKLNGGPIQEQLDAGDTNSVDASVTKPRDNLLQEKLEASDTKPLDISANTPGDNLPQEKLHTSDLNSTDVSSNKLDGGLAQEQLDAGDINSVDASVTESRDNLPSEKLASSSMDSINLSINKLSYSLHQEKVDAGDMDSTDISANK